MADNKQQQNTFTHGPLPYFVTVRYVESDDAVPVITRHKVTAYSIQEAVMQAYLLAGLGSHDPSKFKIDLVEPDIVAFVHLTRLMAGL